MFLLRYLGELFFLVFLNGCKYNKLIMGVRLPIVNPTSRVK